MIFIDTSAWCALFYSKNTHHSEAEEVWREISMMKPQIFSSYDIFDESVTLIRVRAGYDYSFQFGKSFLESRILSEAPPQTDEPVV